MTRISKTALLLMCSVPFVASAERVSINDVVTELAEKPQLRFVKLENHVLDGNSAAFQIRFICSESFNVRSVYITARDPSTTVGFNYTGVSLLSNPFGPALTPPTHWQVGHTDFNTTVSASSVGYELLSNMSVPSLGVGAGGTFDISGSRSPNTQVSTMTIGAVVETTNKPENSCRIVVVDF